MRIACGMLTEGAAPPMHLWNTRKYILHCYVYCIMNHKLLDFDLLLHDVSKRLKILICNRY